MKEERKVAENTSPTSDFPKVKKYGSPFVCDRISFPSPVFAEILEPTIYDVRATKILSI